MDRLGPAVDSESRWKDLRRVEPELSDGARAGRQDWAITSSCGDRLRFRNLAFSGYLQTCTVVHTRKSNQAGTGSRKGARPYVTHLVAVCLDDCWVTSIDLLSEVPADELSRSGETRAVPRTTPHEYNARRVDMC